jgi:hypothetical protein
MRGAERAAHHQICERVGMQVCLKSEPLFGQSQVLCLGHSVGYSNDDCGSFSYCLTYFYLFILFIFNF